MAASGSTVGGYSCELFVSTVPDELKCGLCKQVAREPNLTSCCGDHFCKLCIEQVIQDKKPCPSCEEAEFTIFTNKKYHKRILALEVQCAMKDRGCNWSGTLEQLHAHLDVNSDNCQYVDVKCPNECEQPVQKHHLPTHLANECAKRDFFCQHCNFKATYEVVCNDQWPQCPFYPVPCPNGCEILAIERGDLDAHLMQCSLEEVECDFTYAGCNVKLVREEMEKHLADNLQRHVLMMNKALQEKIEQKERKIGQLEVKLEDRDRQIQELREEKDRQIEEQVKERDRRIQELREERDRQIEELQKKMKEEQKRKIQETQVKVERVEEQLKGHVQEYERRFGVAQFTVNDFQRVKRSYNRWDSSPLYTHQGGYKVGIRVCPHGSYEGYGTHVSVYPCSLKGENDDRLKWPADCTITVQLLNQHRDQDHVTVSKRFQWNKPTTPSLWPFCPPFGNKFIAHKDLDWNAAKQTQYLKNDYLQLRITEIQVHSI